MGMIREFIFPQDYERALLLWKECGEGIGISASDQPEEIEKKLQRDPDLFLVNEENGEITGTVIGGFDGRRGMIYHLAVSPAHRREGLAKQLMSEVENRLKLKGCKKAYLLVKKGNPSALAFYAAINWEEMDHVHLYGKTL